MTSQNGICALCQQPRMLCDSHLIPAGILQLLRDSVFRNPNPFIMSVDYVGQSSAQAKQYLLCTECEQRFSREGERWVAANCSRLSENTFPLRESLRHTPPILSGPEGAVFDASKNPTIDVDKIVYFGTSVIWRAAVASWRVARETRQPLKMSGAHQEQLRRYLLGGPFPQGAVFSIFLVSTTAPLPLALFPESVDENSARVTFRFYIPGIWFLLLLGDNISSDDQNMCILRSAFHPICLSGCADALPVRISHTLYTASKRP